jgi:hypothetical protein
MDLTAQIESSISSVCNVTSRVFSATFPWWANQKGYVRISQHDIIEHLSLVGTMPGKNRSSHWIALKINEVSQCKNIYGAKGKKKSELTKK